MSAHELKALQVRRDKLAAALHIADREVDAAESRRDLIRDDLRSMEAQIAALTLPKRDPVVSEHALLRYVERVLGVDLSAIKDRILTDQNKKAIDFAGSCRIKAEGVELVVKDRVVVSVV